MPAYVRLSTTTPEVIKAGIIYGRIVSVFSIGIFLESIWTKILQAGGNMRVPMIAQICGALINVVLDPILIFGLGPIPATGIAGAAIATVIGQIGAAIITAARGFHRPPALRLFRQYIPQIYRAAFPSITMQSLYTVYIVGLNMILSGFSDSAVTVLGLYYKLQTFFFIPLIGLQTCIVGAELQLRRRGPKPLLSGAAAVPADRRCLHDRGRHRVRVLPHPPDSPLLRRGAGGGNRPHRLPPHRCRLPARRSGLDFSRVLSGHRP